MFWKYHGRRCMYRLDSEVLYSFPISLRPYRKKQRKEEKKEEEAIEERRGGSNREKEAEQRRMGGREMMKRGREQLLKLTLRQEVLATSFSWSRHSHIIRKTWSMTKKKVIRFFGRENGNSFFQKVVQKFWSAKNVSVPQ